MAVLVELRDGLTLGDGKFARTKMDSFSKQAAMKFCVAVSNMLPAVCPAGFAAWLCVAPIRATSAVAISRLTLFETSAIEGTPRVSVIGPARHSA